MKRIMALLIAAVLIFTPATCFAADYNDADNPVPFFPAATTTSTTVTKASAPTAGNLYKLNLGQLSKHTITSMAVSGNTLAILSTRQEGDTEVYDAYISIYDLKKNAVSVSKKLNKYGYTLLRFDGDTLQIRDEFSNKCLKYDKNLKYLGKGKYSYTSLESKAKKNKLIDAKNSFLGDNYALYSNESFYCSVTFYNDKKNVYSMKRKPSVYYAKSYKTNIITYDTSGKNLKVSVNDYSSNKAVTTTFGKNSKYSMNSDGSLLTKNYAYIPIETTTSTALYRWNYAKESKKSFSATKYQSDKIDSKLKSQAKKVSKDYKINLKISPKKDDSIGYGYNPDIKPSVKVVSYLDVVACIKKFPKSVYKRTYDYSGTKFKKKGYKKLNIYLVGKIKSDFAAAYVTDAHSQLYMVLRPDACSYTTFSHEFLHVMDYRICAADRKTNTNWEKLNPKKFKYTYDYYSYYDYYDKHKKFQPYFAKSYGMCDHNEDRATVFEAFVDSYASNQKNPQWLKNKPLKKKTKTLINQIEKQFPDMKKKAPWKNYSAYKTLKK